MDRNISDEKLDRLAKDLLKDFSPDADLVNEIADSPKLWWNVRSAIETEKAARRKGWLPTDMLRILVFGALTAVVLLGVTFLFVGNQNETHQTVVENSAAAILPKASAVNEIKAESPVPEKSLSANPQVQPKRGKNVARSVVPQNVVAETHRRKAAVKSADNTPAETVKTEETKTDFIALTYAGNSESGQVVRMKVPSTMMVSLGVKTHVEKESELVNADVVIGDDGLARAIRFVR